MSPDEEKSDGRSAETAAVSKVSRAQIKADEKELLGQYSNLVVVHHNAEEFTLNFIYMFPSVPQGKLVASLILNPTHAKRLLRALAGKCPSLRGAIRKAAGRLRARPRAKCGIRSVELRNRASRAAGLRKDSVIAASTRSLRLELAGPTPSTQFPLGSTNSRPTANPDLRHCVGSMPRARSSWKEPASVVIIKPVVDLPPASGQHARPARAHIFRERVLRARKRGVTADVHADFHGNTRFTAYCVERFGDPDPKLHIPVPSLRLQAGCYVPEMQFSVIPLPTASFCRARGRPRPIAVRWSSRRPDTPPAHADGDEWLLAVLRQPLADARGGLLRLRVRPLPAGPAANSSPP